MTAPITIFIADSSYPRSSEERLLAAIREWCDQQGLPTENFSVARPKYGKPYLENAPNIHFSVTHSGVFWLCAVSSEPLGLDLQQIKKTQTMKIANRYFHPNEAAFLASHPDSFFTLWTAKESFVKFTGRGIDDEFSDFSVVSSGEIRKSLAGANFCFLPFATDFVLCLCCENPSEVSFQEIP